MEVVCPGVPGDHHCGSPICGGDDNGTRVPGCGKAEQSRLGGDSPWGRKESDTTWRLNSKQQQTERPYCITGSYTQYVAITCNGKESEKEYMGVCV